MPILTRTCFSENI